VKEHPNILIHIRTQEAGYEETNAFKRELQAYTKEKPPV
jgi:hypothetical protein